MKAGIKNIQVEGNNKIVYFSIENTNGEKRFVKLDNDVICDGVISIHRVLKEIGIVVSELET